MFKDPEKRKQANKVSMRKKRGTQKGTQMLDRGTQNTIEVSGVHNLEVHPIMKYLIEPDKRVKMEAIVDSLGHRKLTPHLFFGIGQNGLRMDTVAELLEVTR